MDATQDAITISCHCGTARQTLIPRDIDWISQVSFCHCDTCRHSTGLLCTSYIPISSRHPPTVAGLDSYSTSASSTRYFCSTCGCHIFRASHPSPSTPHGAWDWEVATGVITDAPESNLPKQWRHHHVKDTKDGGLSPWLPASNPPPTPDDDDSTASKEDTLAASCHCTSVSLRITRPSPDPSLNPDSPYPDLLLPYCSTPAETLSNPSREKWYLRPAPTPTSTPSPAEPISNPGPSTSPKQPPTPTRYLAGTCACQTCRLTSGFEIQTWAFIPRQNILISCSSNPNQPPDQDNPQQQTKSHHPDKPHHYQPLDFTPLPTNPTTPSPNTVNRHPLKQYPSTPTITRSFCRRCGATLFWHCTARPDLIDVSAGLFRSTQGSRAEDWLEWWTGRVSFSEEAGRGRARGAKVWGEGVVKGLERGMVASRLRLRDTGQGANDQQGGWGERV